VKAWLGLLPVLVPLMACASSPEPPPAQPIYVPQQPPPPAPPPATSAPTPSPPPPNTLAGSIGGQPFVAQSAVLVRVNEPSTASSSVFPGQKFEVFWSFLFVFDKPMGCGDVPRSLTPAADRYVKFDVTGHWPFADGATFALGTGAEAKTPAADRFSGNIWHGRSGSVLRGTVRVVHGASNPALLDMDVSTATTGVDTSGSLRGSVAVTVCH
jgi:hypothetical protein